MPKKLPDRLTDVAFTVAAGRRDGLSRSRMRASDLVTPFPRVRMPAHWAEPFPRGATVDEKVQIKRKCVYGLARAVRVRMPRAAVLAVTTAAYLHVIPLPLRFLDDDRVHVTVARGRRAPTGQGIVGHSATLGNGDVTRVDGLTVTSLERTWCDLAAVLDVPDLVAAGDALIHHRARRTTARALAAAVRRYPTTRWRSRRAEALSLLNERAESPRESRLRVHLVQAGLPEPAVNPSVFYRGVFLGRVDMLYLEWALIIEYEGEQHRTDAWQWRKDIARVNDFADIGLRTIRATAADDRDPSRLIERIRGHIAADESGVARDPAFSIRW